MNPRAVAKFAARAARDRQSSFAVEVIFRDVVVRAIISQQSSLDTLGVGGMREDVTWKIRMPAHVQPAPGYDAVGHRITESIEEIGTGRKFGIIGCTPANPLNPLHQEHIVEAAIV